LTARPSPPAPRREATFVLRDKLPIPCTADEKIHLRRIK
jgi:hypothetical protein